MSLQKRSISISGHRTSIALEPEFWEVFDAMCRSANRTPADMIAEIDRNRGSEGLASAIRVHLLNWVGTQQSKTP